MFNRRSRLVLVAICALSLGLAACGKDGGGTPVASVTTVTGTVNAPSGQLANAEPGLFRWFASLFVGEVHAQAGPGLSPVPNTNILVFQIGNDGNPVTSATNPTGILAQTTTGANGAFSVNLPAGTSLASNVIVQATTGTTPARVCDPSTPGCPANQTQLNCPAVGTNLAINPAAELATRQILAKIALAGATGSLSNYTNAEIGAFIGLVQSTVAANPALIGVNLATTLAAIAASPSVTNLVASILPGIETPGVTPPPAGSAATVTYNFTGFEAQSQQGGTLSRSAESGTVVLNSTGAWSFAGQSQGAQLTESCSSSATCNPTFTQSAINQPNTDSGTYVRLGSGRIIFTSQDGSQTLIFTNPLETILVVKTGDFGFGVATKQGSGLSNATAAGVFNFTNFDSSLQNTGPNGNTWPGPLRSSADSGTATFTGSNVTVSGNGSDMVQQVTCASLVTGCTLSATLTASPFTDAFTSLFSTTSDGILTITDTKPGTAGNQSTIGTVSADGVVGLFRDTNTSGAGITVATRQASGLSNASLSGTYNLIVFGDVLTTAGAITTFVDIGTVTFNGAGNQTIQTAGTNVSRSESCPSTGACSIGAVTTVGSFTETRPYSLTANGALQITSPAQGTINGVVSPDATFGITTNVVDNVGGSSLRVIALAVKQ